MSGGLWGLIRQQYLDSIRNETPIFNSFRDDNLHP